MIALGEAHYLGTLEHFRQLDGLTASVTSYPDIAFSEHLHYHEALHMSLILRGGNLEKRKSVAIDRLPGTMTYYDAGEWHQSTQTRKSSQSVNLEISDAWLRRYALKPDLNRPAPGKAALLLKIYREQICGDQDSALGMEALVLAILSPATTVGRCGLPDWVRPVCELLHDRWQEQLTLDSLAAVVGIHPVHLSAAFSLYFGDTIGGYRRKLRIEKALPLVTGTCRSLTDIALFCGFADQSHFIRAFRQQTGWLPNRLRSLTP